MAFFRLRFCVVAYIFYQIAVYCQTEEEIRSQIKPPTITIAILVRNKAHTLPYFLTAIDQLDYPKDRINLWIYSDYNSDNSIEILREWKKFRGSLYHKFYLKTDNSTPMYYSDEKNVSSWTPLRRKHVIKLREKSIDFARSTWSDYLFMLDADVILTDPETLKSLVWLSSSIVTGPMLESEGLYSNFWHDMSKDYAYKRTEEYPSIVKREKELVGCHDVPMVHTAVLVSLKHKDSDKLTFDPEKLSEYTGPMDDTIAFSVSSMKIGSKLKVCNVRPYGFLTMPTVHSSTHKKELQKLVNIKLKALSKGVVFPIHDILAKYVSYPEPSKLTMCKIYMINLARRSERRYLMSQNFKELGMDVDIYDAVDGKKLTKEDLDDLDVKPMPEFLDPFSSRPMTAGEIGCFLSHYNIWNEIVEKGYNLTMILEDDIQFASYFKEKLARVLKEAEGYKYDLLYLGRKVLAESGETRITEHTVRPSYSYWTLGYVLSYDGAAKLLKASPLKNLLPVDEYLPIMYNSHPKYVKDKETPKVEPKPIESNSIESNSIESNSIESNSKESNSIESNSIESNSIESNSIESNSIESNSIESNSIKSNSIEPEPTKPKPIDPKPIEPKPIESKPTEPKPTETIPTETKPTGPKATDTKPTESNSIESNSIESNSIESNSIESNSIESNSIESNSIESNSIKSNSIEPEPTKPKPIDPKPIEPKPIESKPTKPKPTKSKRTKPKPKIPQAKTPEEGAMGVVAYQTMILILRLTVIASFMYYICHVYR